DGFDISRARPGLGSPELLDERRMFALGLCNVLRIEIPKLLLSGGRSNRQRRRGQQQKRLTHHHLRYALTNLGDFERKMTRSVPKRTAKDQPIARNFARRCARSSFGPSAAQPSNSSMIAPFKEPIAASGSRCAPPSGSGTIRSTTPSACWSAAVIFIASAASAALSAVRQRIDAQPSGEITE